MSISDCALCKEASTYARAWGSPACGPCTLLAVFLSVIELLCTGNTVVNKTGEFCALKEFNIPGVEDGQFLREAIDHFNR